MSLNNIVIEQICDNYYRGEFLGLDLIIDKNTGFFNASKLCKDGNKEFKFWRNNKKTKELFKFVEKISPGKNSYLEKPSIKSGKYSSVETKQIGEEIILDLASWISHDTTEKGEIV